MIFVDLNRNYNIFVDYTRKVQLQNGTSIKKEMSKILENY